MARSLWDLQCARRRAGRWQPVGDGWGGAWGLGVGENWGRERAGGCWRAGWERYAVRFVQTQSWQFM